MQSLCHPLLFSEVDRVIAVSKDATSSTLARHRTLNKKLITIPNGIDTKPFSRRCSKALIREKLKLPAQKQIIGAIGRLTTQKGYCHLLQSFAQVKRTVAEAYLLVIGEGELLDSLQQLTRELQLDGSVQFLGVRTDILDLLLAMDVFVMSSLWEGLPIALLEAMATGVPCVATAVGGIPEVIDHGKDGLLIPAGDSGALAKAVVTLLQDSSFAQLLARNALSKVQSRYSVQRMVKDHEKLYKQLHFSRSSSRPETSVGLETQE